MHTPREYAAVFAARRVLRSACFDLLQGREGGFGVRDIESLSSVSQSRLGLVIPKRLARRAILRNTIKRQAREAFRHHCETLPTVDLVLRLARWPKDMMMLTAKSDVLKHLVRQEIESLLEKLRQRSVPVAAANE